MKFYIHYELGDPEFTLPVSVDSSSEKTVADIKSDFIAAYNSRFPSNQLDQESYSLSLSKHKLLGGNDGIVSVVKPNSDVYLIARKADSKPKKGEAVKIASEAEKITPTVASSPKAIASIKSSPKDEASSQKVRDAPPPAKRGSNESQKKWARPTPINLSVPPQVSQVCLV